MPDLATFALVTGALSVPSQAWMTLLAQRGQPLILVDDDEQPLNVLADSLRSKFPVRIQVIAAQLHEATIPQRVFTLTQQLGLPVDTLILHQRMTQVSSFHQSSVDQQVKLLQSRLVAQVVLTRLFLPAMVERGFGRIIFLSDNAGPAYTQMLHKASEHFARTFCDELSRQYGDAGVVAFVHAPDAKAKGAQMNPVNEQDFRMHHWMDEAARQLRQLTGGYTTTGVLSKWWRSIFRKRN